MQNVLTILWGHVFNYEKSIARAVYLNHFMDIALNFEKSVGRAVCLHGFKDKGLDHMSEVVCFLHFTDIA